MADVYCAVCGEPWDYYGVCHGDMTEEEAGKFLKGKGCPACGFGEECPHCYGKGMELCPICHGLGNISTKICSTKICPMCEGDGHTDLPCPFCKGTGKPGGGNKLTAAVSECEASDDDPVKILMRRGF